MGAKVKQRVNVFEACERACARLLEVGFILHHQSRQTEARYYRWPDREHTLRVAAHKSKKAPMGLPRIAARITFATDGACEQPNCVAISDEHFEHMVATAIGIYMMRSALLPTSNYQGKRGTWEGCGNLGMRVTP